MPDRTAQELSEDFRKLVQGIERDVQQYEKNVAAVVKSQTDYESFLNSAKAALADRNNLTAERVSELAALAGVVTVQLNTAHDLVTRMTKTGSKKNIMANTPGWIKDDIAKAKGAIDQILSQMKRLSSADQATVHRAMIENMYDADTLAANPELYKKAIKDVWKDYTFGASARIDKIKDQPKDLISHPERIDQQLKTVDQLLKQLAAALEQADKARQKQSAIGAGILKSVTGPPKPRIMYPHR